MPRKIEHSSIVITGPSSGIGRATALAFADRGASVVLAARREDALHEVAGECTERGGRALVVPTDVSDERAVEHLAHRAVEELGRIDVWVNNAAVSVFGRFEETPTDAIQRLFQTNFFGYLYGGRAALRRFREQGEGVLVNVDSVVAGAPQPYTSAYVASQCAIRGLFDCLRMELRLDEASDIHVCTVLPASIDTPLFQQAANYTGRAVKALEPAYPAAKVAEAIVRLAERPRREVVVGGAGRLAMAEHAMAPAVYERMFARAIDSGRFQDRPAERGPGNLFHPMPEHASVSGGWGDGVGGNGVNGRAALGAAAATLAVAVPAALVWAARSGKLSRPGAGRGR